MSRDKFYDSPAWRRLSARHLKFNPFCAVDGCNQRARHVDHIATRKDAPQRSLDPSNLQSLCKHHHGLVTRSYDSGTLAGACDVDGNPLDPNHPWNQASNADAIKAVNREPVRDPATSAKLKRRLRKPQSEW